jgi:ATP-dependent helicase/DNAse subunit B
MPKRVQSPSSINTFKQCPRKYFYQYIIKHPTKENIHCIRGNIVHDALEKFFSIDITAIDPDSFKKELSFYLKNLFDACWSGAKNRLSKVGLDDSKLQFYHDESMQMLANWLNHLFEDIDSEIKQNNTPLKQAFKKLAPDEMEKHFKDGELMVRGFIDAIHREGEHITVMDYKTSKSDEMKPEYLLQLGIYAVLYEKQHGNYPNKVGIWFLKHGPNVIDVTPKLIKDAEFEIEQIHFATESEQIRDYPKKESGLCRWSTGQCDFYDICIKDR